MGWYEIWRNEVSRPKFLKNWARLSRNNEIRKMVYWPEIGSSHFWAPILNLAENANLNSYCCPYIYITQFSKLSQPPN